MPGQKSTEPHCISLQWSVPIHKGKGRGGGSREKDESQGRVTFTTEMGGGVGSQLDSAQVQSVFPPARRVSLLSSWLGRLRSVWFGAGVER